MATLIGFDTIMTAFHCGVCPAAAMVIHDLFLPISQMFFQFQSLLNSSSTGFSFEPIFF
jgi:hypothetical protein